MPKERLKTVLRWKKDKFSLETGQSLVERQTFLPRAGKRREQASVESRRASRAGERRNCHRDSSMRRERSSRSTRTNVKIAFMENHQKAQYLTPKKRPLRKKFAVAKKLSRGPVLIWPETRPLTKGSIRREKAYIAEKNVRRSFFATLSEKAS